MKLSLICIWIWLFYFKSVRCREAYRVKEGNLAENSNISLIFGVVDFESWSSENQTIDANKPINHPRYDNKTFFADISLLELKTAVICNKYVQPVFLPNATTHFRHGRSCVVSGYGYTQGTGKEDVLNYADVKIISHLKCKSWYSKSMHNITVPEDHVCAGLHRGGVDSCQGDSGGPLVCENSHSNSTDYILVGVTSFGEECAVRHKPGVYTNVTTYLEWIMQHIAPAPPSPRGTTNGSEARIAQSFFSLLAFFLFQYSVHSID